MRDRKTRFCLRLSVVEKELKRQGKRLMHVSWGAEAASLPRRVLEANLLRVLNVSLRGKHRRQYLTQQDLSKL